MKHDLKPYPAYKDAGVAQLGKVPEHWQVRRQRNVLRMLVSTIDKHTLEGELPVRLCNYVDVYKNERITGSIPFMRATAAQEEIMRFRLQSGDVLITKDSESWNDIGVPALVEYSAPDLVCGYHLAILRPYNTLLVGDYLLRALQSQGVAVKYHVAANGVTRYGLSHDAIKSIVLPVPPITEQTAIVGFLGHIDRRIRRHIRAKQTLISLLNEQKQAIIDRTVGRGLDPNVRFKASGVEWLGDVPEHWRILRAKYVFREIDHRSERGEETHLSMSQKLGLVPTATVEQRTLLSETYVGGKLCEKGDLVLNRLKAHLGVFARATQSGVVSPDYTVLRPKSPMVVPYFEHILRSPTCRYELRIRAKGIVQGFWRLYTDDFYDIRLPVPPVKEQEQIVTTLDAQTASMRKAIERAEQEIDIFREYRSRLIADVVTGKLDVRSAAAQLPREAEEPKPLGEADTLADSDEENGVVELDAASGEPVDG